MGYGVFNAGQLLGLVLDLKFFLAGINIVILGGSQ
jgi:hypothetical protein